MLNKMFMSAVVMLVGLMGVVATSGAEVTNLDASEQVCVAAHTAQELVPPGPTAACPSYCGPARVACVAGCNGDTACRALCQDQYITCCGF
ncbi:MULTISPECIES: hypothetical protein [unclassified Myxococcus]|uniref:hypothetical protein n=1 Tax=unclassified Myxococcus TaxID=2648731 RepID=UPI001CBB19BF|nr:MULTISPECIES: hypothetical protein [unclassified Myxococcus]MBZ4398429.1 hypothetical protein [Myxococcus sp. AS-1-15]MBZ4412670.1 hypothetical protein [Myxococcus sp. XM-1-1-1]